MWNPISTAPEGRLVMTKIDDVDGVRNERVMLRNRTLWFVGDTYVYYAPTHWRDLTLVEKLRIKNDLERRAIH